MPFQPNFTITPAVAASLMRIEAVKAAVEFLPMTTHVLATLRETARLYSTRYSTMIEENRLTQEEVGEVIGKHAHFPGRERDEKEVLGYYAALEKVEGWPRPAEVLANRRSKCCMRSSCPGQQTNQTDSAL